jgi:hypothetical protein
VSENDTKVVDFVIQVAELCIRINLKYSAMKTKLCLKKIILSLIFLLGLLSHTAFGQIDSENTKFAVKDTQNLNIRLFDSNDPLEISLRFDITTYKRERSDTNYLEAILTYHTTKTDSINKNIKLKARGEILRTAICDLPPMSLNFKLKDTIGGEFTGIDELKLMTYCNPGYEDYILREYLIYKLYNLLTDNSLKVRLLRINFINTAKKSKPIRQYGFAIEPVKLLANRTHTLERKPVNLSQKNIKPEMMDRLAIFNLMIGNTDWAVSNQHNTLILSQPGSAQPELYAIVPLEFDYSGLVNADYAVPYENLPINTVRERLYMGMCRSEEVYKNEVREFAEKKDEFYKLINDFQYLNPKSKEDMIDYLNGFFDMFDKHNSIIHEMLNQCRDL